MKKIDAKVIADSICNKNRITTMLVTMPRFVLAYFNMYRMFSRNSSNNKIIPFKKIVRAVEKDPFIPIVWMKTRQGLKGNEYLGSESSEIFKYYSEEITKEQLENEWIEARNTAIERAISLNNLGVSKQLCTSILMPFMWENVLITATEWSNFLEQQCPKYTYDNKIIFRSKKDMFKEYNIRLSNSDGSELTNKDWIQLNRSSEEPHMQMLAEAMYDTLNESVPKELQPNEWHIPFGDKINFEVVKDMVIEDMFKSENNSFHFEKLTLEKMLKVATARCARLSYLTSNNEINYDRDIELYNKLLENKYLTSFEHCAKTMTQKEYDSFIRKGEQGWFNNFKGWIQYRYLINYEK